MVVIWSSTIMKKFLLISIFFISHNLAYASDTCDFSWQIKKSLGKAVFTIENQTSDVAKISSATIYTKEGTKMYRYNFDHKPIYVYPFYKKTFDVWNQQLLWDIAGKAGISCYPMTKYAADLERQNKLQNKYKGKSKSKSGSQKLLDKILGN